MCSTISRPIYDAVCVFTDTLTEMAVPETTCYPRVERGVPLASVIYPALPSVDHNVPRRLLGSLPAAVVVRAYPRFEEPIAWGHPKHYSDCHEEYVVYDDDNQFGDQKYNYYWEY